MLVAPLVRFACPKQKKNGPKPKLRAVPHAIR
jgi:hypothetical protein